MTIRWVSSAGMSKADRTAKLAYIRRLCLSSESIHSETAKLVADLPREDRRTSSAEPVKAEPIKRPRT
jgi:hypothetical protein